MGTGCGIVSPSTDARAADSSISDAQTRCTCERGQVQWEAGREGVQEVMSEAAHSGCCGDHTSDQGHEVLVVENDQRACALQQAPSSDDSPASSTGGSSPHLRRQIRPLRSQPQRKQMQRSLPHSSQRQRRQMLRCQQQRRPRPRLQQSRLPGNSKQRSRWSCPAVSLCWRLPGPLSRRRLQGSR